MKHINLPFIVFFAQSIIWSINSNLSSNTIAKPYNDDLSNNSDSITLFDSTQHKISSCPNTHKNYVLELVLSELDELPEKDHLLMLLM